MKAIEEITLSVCIDGPHLFGCKLCENDSRFFNLAVRLQLNLLLDTIPNDVFDHLLKLIPGINHELGDIEIYLTQLGQCDDVLLRLRHITDVNETLNSRDLARVTAPLIGAFKHVREFLWVTQPSLKVCHSFFLFLKKIDFLQDYGDLGSQCFFNLQKTQARLSQLSFDEETGYDIWNMRQIMTEWFSDVDMSVFRPHHGPGVVAETEIGRDKYLKNLLMTSTIDQEQLLDQLHLGIREFNPFSHFVISQIPARFISVPKAWNKRRGICAEPAGNQFFQQGIKETLYSYIQFHPYLGSRIKLRDQSNNQHYARIASSYGYATIDLSDASDSVSLPLVESIFADCSLLPWLLASRSTSCNYTRDGEVTDLPLLSFSPMGSAVCFPLECLVFAVACEYVSRQFGDLASRGFDGLTNWSVFGDDIIVKDFMSKRVRRLLRRLGFVVNESKSFAGGPFAESCGGEYFHGQEITPLRCKFSSSILYHTAESYVKLRDFCNCSMSRGFLTTRYSALRMLMGTYKIVFTSDPLESHKILTMGLVRNTCTRRNRNLQVPESLCATLVQLQRTRDGHAIVAQESSYSDEIEYLTWLRKRQIRPDGEDIIPTLPDHFHSNPQWSEYRIRDKWTL